MEIACALAALVPGLVVAVLLHRRAAAGPPAERPPIPIAAAIAAASLAVVAVPIGVALGYVLFPRLVEHAVPATGAVAMLDVESSLLAPLRVGVALGAALALPGLVALGALLVLRDRSVGLALRLALGVAAGVLAGAHVGALVLAPRAAAWLIDGAGMQLGYLSYEELAGFLAGTVLAAALAMALPPGVAIAAARSRESFRVALAWVPAVPGLALLVAAPITPPDLVSQLSVAVVLGAAWGAGLLVAALVRAIRPS